jgi:CheY-like chemotaxis protein
MQVLIVEDNPDSRETLERYLTRREYDVAAAGNLRTGINFLRKNRFDAIISDISLPDGTGYTLINEARRRGIRALGIAMSRYPYPSNVNQPGSDRIRLSSDEATRLRRSLLSPRKSAVSVTPKMISG